MKSLTLNKNRLSEDNISVKRRYIHPLKVELKYGVKANFHVDTKLQSTE